MEQTYTYCVADHVNGRTKTYVYHLAIEGALTSLCERCPTGWPLEDHDGGEHGRLCRFCAKVREEIRELPEGATLDDLRKEKRAESQRNRRAHAQGQNWQWQTW